MAGKKAPAGGKTKARRDHYFLTEAAEWLVSLGAVPPPPGALGSSRQLMLESKAGPLFISVYPDWVACMFRDVVRAYAEFTDIGSINPYSGKYNLHFTACGTANEDRMRALQQHIRRVLPIAEDLS